MRLICMWIGAKPLCIMFVKVNGFIRHYDGTKN